MQQQRHNRAEHCPEQRPYKQKDYVPAGRVRLQSFYFVLLLAD